MTFTPEQLELVAAKQRGDAIRSSDWNIVVDEVQEVGEQVELLDNTKVNRNGDTITGELSIQAGTGRTTIGRTGNNGIITTGLTLWQHSDGPLGGSVNPMRIPGNNYTLDFKSEGGFAFAPGMTPGSTNAITGNQILRSVFITPNGVGIGTTQPQTQFHVVGNAANSNAAINGHIAFIRNTGTTGANILALQLGNSGVINANNNYISFLRGNGTFAGAIDGGGANNTIRYQSVGSDYAEWLPCLQEDEVIEAGDIVGVFGGKVTKTTEKAHHFMAITDRPIVLGNMPDKEQEHLYEQVSFIGQIPIKVRGSVQAGDYIIPSGLNDGTGIAVAPQDLTPSQCGQIVGRAWESSDEVEVKRVNAAVGLDNSSAVATSLMSEMETLKAELQELKREKSLV